MRGLARIKAFIKSRQAIFIVVLGAILLGMLMLFSVPSMVTHGLYKILPFVQGGFLPYPTYPAFLIYAAAPAITIGVIFMFLKAQRPYLAAFIGTFLGIPTGLILVNSMVRVEFLAYFMAGLITFAVASRIIYGPSAKSIGVAKTSNVRWIVIAVLIAAVLMFTYATQLGTASALGGHIITMAIIVYSMPVVLLGVGLYWLVSAKRKAKDPKNKQVSFIRIVGSVAVISSLFMLGLMTSGIIRSFSIDAKLFIGIAGSLALSLGITHIIVRKSLSYANVILAVSGLAILVVFYIMYSVRL